MKGFVFEVGTSSEKEDGMVDAVGGSKDEEAMLGNGGAREDGSG